MKKLPLYVRKLIVACIAACAVFLIISIALLDVSWFADRGEIGYLRVIVVVAFAAGFLIEGS